jgi:hypothetical protein
VSTVLATVAVKKASCFGRSSESATRESRVPVFVRDRIQIQFGRIQHMCIVP